VSDEQVFNESREREAARGDKNQNLTISQGASVQLKKLSKGGGWGGGGGVWWEKKKKSKGSLSVHKNGKKRKNFFLVGQKRLGSS